ncbi:amidohydrolase family protein [Variovorax paradoxus]|uniref:amidohydrolase family protein n=1 Tax=Variovorax paradoxus TaxID=34073 RepID=UPI0019334187|nr:amidohydrolase family protein [Variovorax paradoxus]
MKTIDMHVHVGTFPALEASGEYLRTRADVASFRTRHPERYAAIATQAPEDNGARLLQAMDENGIDISCVQARPGISNDLVAAIARNHPARLVPLAVPTPWPTSADPPRQPIRTLAPEAVAAELERCVALGMRAVGELYVRRVTNRLHPEEIADDLEPLMQVVERHGMSVQIPTAWTQSPGGLVYGDPIWVDEVAYRYPRTPIVLTKMGRGLQRYFDSTLSVAIRNQNIHVDTTDTTVEHLRTFIGKLGAGRVLYGSDWSPAWQFLRDPGSVHDNAKQTIAQSQLSDGDLEKIFWSNASALYGPAHAHWLELHAPAPPR